MAHGEDAEIRHRRGKLPDGGRQDDASQEERGDALAPDALPGGGLDLVAGILWMDPSDIAVQAAGEVLESPVAELVDQLVERAVEVPVAGRR